MDYLFDSIKSGVYYRCTVWCILGVLFYLVYCGCTVGYISIDIYTPQVYTPVSVHYAVHHVEYNHAE